MIGEDHTIAVDRAPGSIPCDHCLDHLEEGMRYSLIGMPEETASGPTRVWTAWAAFRAEPSEPTWRPFIFTLAMVSAHVVRPVLGDIDPWPDSTISEIDSADRFWSGS